MNSQDLQQFDELLKKRLKEELKSFATKDDLKGLATKNDLGETEARLSRKIEREVADLGELIGEGFKAIGKKLDITEAAALAVRVSNLEEKVRPN